MMGGDRKSKDKSSSRKRNLSLSASQADEGKVRKRHRREEEKEENVKRRSRESDKKEKRKETKSGSHRSGKEKKSRDKHKTKHRKGDRHMKFEFPELSSDDYFAKNNEFATWLKEEKNVFFSDLSSESARELFSDFVKDWNNQKLEYRYYEGIASGPRTAHSWKIKK